VRRVVDVSVRCSGFAVDGSRVVSLFRALDAFGGDKVPAGDLSVVFVDEHSMISLHDRFLGDPTPTDVLTFGGDGYMDFAGEIIVCPDYGLGRCGEFGTTLDDEIILYLVHGYLHLAGLDDGSAADVARMREAEARCMDQLKTLRDGRLIKYLGQ
jgi:probable rRNA maturation factor